jgi:hypothetical protein
MLPMTAILIAAGVLVMPKLSFGDAVDEFCMAITAGEVATRYSQIIERQMPVLTVDRGDEAVARRSLNLRIDADGDPPFYLNVRQKASGETEGFVLAAETNVFEQLEEVCAARGATGKSTSAPNLSLKKWQLGSDRCAPLAKVWSRLERLTIPAAADESLYTHGTSYALRIQAGTAVATLSMEGPGGPRQPVGILRWADEFMEQLEKRCLSQPSILVVPLAGAETAGKPR